MATKAVEIEKLANGQGCLANAAEDEPVFILRAQDRLAPTLVHLWSMLADLAPTAHARNPSRRASWPAK